jgi:lysophospholipase L1-like esterase
MGKFRAVRMRTTVWALPALGLFCASTVQAEAAAYVLGDSLGLGVAQAAHLKNLSKISIHIRGPKMLKQIAQTPSGSTVFLVLGTNDANGSIAKLDKSIDTIVQAMEKKNLTVVWMGPPCVRQSWDTRARDLDIMLKNRFENTAVRYVSMRDEAMCSGDFHERDGVHLKMKGYAHMWEKARSAVGFAVAAAAPEPDVAHTGSVIARATSTGHSKKAKRIPLPVPRKPFP